MDVTTTLFLASNRWKGIYKPIYLLKQDATKKICMEPVSKQCKKLLIRYIYIYINDYIKMECTNDHYPLKMLLFLRGGEVTFYVCMYICM